MSHSITIHNRTFPTIKEAAAFFDMPRETLSRKVNSGVSAEEAVDNHLARMKRKRQASKKNIRHQSITCAGKTFPSIAAFARAIKQPEPTVRSLLGKGMSPDKIAQNALLPSEETYTRHRKKRIDVKKGSRLVVNGERFANTNHLAATYDMPKEIVKDRLDKGWAPAQAVGLTPPPDGRAPTLMPIDFNGKAYPSLKALAEDIGIDISAMMRRVNNGEDVVNVIEQLQRQPKQGESKKPVSTSHTLTLNKDKAKYAYRATDTSEKTAIPPQTEVNYNGETYRSETALAAAYGVPVATFMAKRSQGASFEEALGERVKRVATTSSLQREREPIVVFGKRYKSVASLARDYDIAPHRIRYCLQINDDVEALLKQHQDEKASSASVAENGRKRQPIDYKGKTYATITDLANAYGIKPNTLASRLRKGKSLPVAIGEKVSATSVSVCDVNKRPDDTVVEQVEKRQPKKVSYQVGDLTFYSVAALAEHFHLSADTVAYRLSEGATPAQAVGQIQWQATPSRGKTLVIGDHHFPSIKDAARFYGVNYQTLRRRLQEGISPEKAVGANLPDSLQVGEHHFTSVAHFAEHYRLDADITQRRLLAGWSAAEILGDVLPPRSRYVEPVKQ